MDRLEAVDLPPNKKQKTSVLTSARLPPRPSSVLGTETSTHDSRIGIDLAHHRGVHAENAGLPPPHPSLPSKPPLPSLSRSELPPSQAGPSSDSTKRSRQPLPLLPEDDELYDPFQYRHLDDVIAISATGVVVGNLMHEAWSSVEEMRYAVWKRFRPCGEISAIHAPVAPEPQAARVVCLEFTSEEGARRALAKNEVYEYDDQTQVMFVHSRFYTSNGWRVTPRSTLEAIQMDIADNIERFSTFREAKEYEMDPTSDMMTDETLPMTPAPQVHPFSTLDDKHWPPIFDLEYSVSGSAGIFGTNMVATHNILSLSNKYQDDQLLSNRRAAASKLPDFPVIMEKDGRSWKGHNGQYFVWESEHGDNSLARRKLFAQIESKKSKHRPLYRGVDRKLGFSFPPDVQDYLKVSQLGWSDYKDPDAELEGIKRLAATKSREILENIGLSDLVQAYGELHIDVQEDETTRMGRDRARMQREWVKAHPGQSYKPMFTLDYRYDKDAQEQDIGYDPDVPLEFSEPLPSTPLPRTPSPPLS
nr:uncharacterized protein CI109_002212 [Kwoniella shandongensis]KAA5529319.1 hypothetical protein CI109_002212 [Kwoniella shandongensis]